MLTPNNKRQGKKPTNYITLSAVSFKCHYILTIKINKILSANFDVFLKSDSGIHNHGEFYISNTVHARFHAGNHLVYRFTVLYTYDEKKPPIVLNYNVYEYNHFHMTVYAYFPLNTRNK